MTATSQTNKLAAEWRAARLLYPLYAALAREFVIDLPPCRDLEAGAEAPPQKSVELARQWFLDMDQRIQVHQLRHFLQTTSLISTEGLRTLLEHHLHKPQRASSDRDKIDFLLVQFFSHCAPSHAEEDVDIACVAQVLEPVLGTLDLTVPVWLQPLDGLIQSANRCRSLNELLTSGILEQGRKLKIESGENYFQPAAMAIFARYSFLVRQVFFRLMHQDLNAILDGLRELEFRGMSALDCRAAQFSAEEPIVRLRMICQSWKVMFHAEYSSGQPLRLLVDLHNVVEAALAATPTSASQTSASAAPRARAAAATGEFAATSSQVPEFEVTSGPDDWDQDSAAAHGAELENDGEA
jgi:hypothetical protein